VKKTVTYLRLGRLALAMAFLTASSGFTMVLHSCLMEDMACCGAMTSGGSMPSPSGESTGGASLVKLASSCCENTVVGGLNRTAATLESQQAPVHQKIVLAAANPDLPVGQVEDCSSFVMLRHLRPTDSPPTGLYLSNSALLI
jgi:hypothetical protein